MIPLNDPRHRPTVMTGPIDRLGVLAIRGADAAQFSHSQLANDVKALPNGHWQWNALLQIQGRVLALLLVARRADDELLLVLPREIRGDVRSTLSRYVLRSKVRIEEDDTLQVEGRWSPHDPADSGAPPGSGPLRVDADGITLPFGGRSGRALAIVPTGASSGASIDDAWRKADIDDGIPWIRIGTVGEFIPQALGLTRLSAYSVSKGCYPGQEIVARTHFLGRNKRVLRRFSGPESGSSPAPGDRLHGNADDAGDPIAVVVDALTIGGRIVGLAVARDADVRGAWWRSPSGALAVTLADT
jgi:folate-binding protein YgfZ